MSTPEPEKDEHTLSLRREVNRPWRRLGRHWPTALLSLALATILSAVCADRQSQEPLALSVNRSGRQVQPFPLRQVRLADGILKQKQDRMLRYARSFGGDTDPYAGPDRLLSIFRANAGLDTKGAEPVGGWETATGYLRGHYAGHFMSLLAQAYAGTGDEIYKQKLDYMVTALAECQTALAESVSLPTPRVAGLRGGALKLSGSPLGQAEHVRLPSGNLGLSRDLTIATWLKLAHYEASFLPDDRQTPAQLTNGTVVFDFGSPNPDYAEPPHSHMYLTVRASDERPVPRFAITREGVEGEQFLESEEPLPIGEWVHIAVTRSGPKGTLYVDGEAVAATADLTLAPEDLEPMQTNWIGRRQFPQRSVSYLNATVDDFFVSSRSLSADEVLTLMRSPDKMVGDGIEIWYQFDEKPGPIVNDDSGYGRDAEVLAPTDGRRHPGFLSAYPETQFMRLEEFATYGASQGIWAPYYTLHKIMAGLLDAHLLADNELALDILTGIGDWVHWRLAPLQQQQLDRMWDIYIAGEYGGINESLAALHAIVPERREYLEAAERFTNLNIYPPIAANEDVLEGRHANQHIPQFTGYLRIYEQGHDEAFLEAAENFWNMIIPDRIYSHGGVGVSEMLQGSATAASLFAEQNHAETCPLYNLLKLSRNLFFHDPEAKYMDYYELGLFNQLAGSRRDVDSVDSPEATYFVPVRPGSRRRYGNVGTCCGGTGLESHTKYQDSIYFSSVDASTLYVNLYIASTLSWPERGLTVRQQTRFPEEGASRLVIEGSGELDIELRVPAWAQRGYKVSINGELQDLQAIPGSYVNLSRRWSRGDHIDITMPFSFRLVGTVDDPSVQSLYYGPVLLAAQTEAVGEDLQSGLLEVSFYRDLGLDGDLASALTPGEEPLQFTTNGLELAPFFIADPLTPPAATANPAGGEESSGQPYHIYFRRHEPQIVFGSVDSGVPNMTAQDGSTFLDNLWSEAPFADQEAFLAVVKRLASTWESSGVFTSDQRSAILNAAREAEEDLRN